MSEKQLSIPAFLNEALWGRAGRMVRVNIITAGLTLVLGMATGQNFGWPAGL